VNRFFTYLWLREDGSPYYAGKGILRRAFMSHRHGIRHLCVPKEKDRIILQEWDTEHDAFEAEKLLIAIYGRKDQGVGMLINLTDGGDQPPSRKGAKMPPDSIRRTVEAKKLSGYTMSLENRRIVGEKNRLKMKGRKLSDERRKKISVSLLGNKRTSGRIMPEAEKLQRSRSLLTFHRQKLNLQGRVSIAERSLETPPSNRFEIRP
jgi:hypothetical protein